MKQIYYMLHEICYTQNALAYTLFDDKHIPTRGIFLSEYDKNYQF